MKKMNTLLTLAVIGCVGGLSGTAQAGNYRPTNPRTSQQAGPVELERSSPQRGGEQKSVYGPQPLNGTKTANCYDSCYTVPVCGPTYCTPVIRCNSSCSPRPYFPASPMYSTPAYSNYSGYNYGAYPNYGGGGYGAGFGGGAYNPGYMNSGFANPGYANPGFANPGYANPGYATPYNQGVPMPYNSGVIGNGVGVGSPYIAPVGNGAPGYFQGNYNAGYAPNIAPVNQQYYGNPGFNSPLINQPVIGAPVYNEPIYDSPFYP